MYNKLSQNVVALFRQNYLSVVTLKEKRMLEEENKFLKSGNISKQIKISKFQIDLKYPPLQKNQGVNAF